MGKQKKIFLPRTIDRTVFAVLAALNTLVGLYLAGPFYLDETPVGKSPIYSLLHNHLAVSIYGLLMLVDALGMFYAAFGSGHNYIRITSSALMAGFMLRVVGFVGLMFTLPGWLPPGYLADASIMILFGAYRVWIKVSERITQ